MKTELTPHEKMLSIHVQFLSGIDWLELSDLINDYARIYHASQLESGIRTKALKKKGTDKWYYVIYKTWFNEQIIDNNIDVLLSSILSDKNNPACYPPDDAQEVNIIILEETKQ